MQIVDAVVVGVDAGRPDRALLSWAAEEASVRKAGLVVCHVWEWGDAEHSPRLLADTVAAEATPAELSVREAARLVRQWFPELDVSVVFGQGRPARTLARLCEQASMGVVGARGRGGFSGLLLGSVSAQLAAHARCPVAVVRPPSSSAATDVVVGVDGSPEAERTVRLAAGEARRLGGNLVLVHGYRPPTPGGVRTECRHRRATPPGRGRGRRGTGRQGTGHRRPRRGGADGARCAGGRPA